MVLRLSDNSRSRTESLEVSEVLTGWDELAGAVTVESEAFGSGLLKLVLLDSKAARLKF